MATEVATAALGNAGKCWSERRDLTRDPLHPRGTREALGEFLLALEITPFDERAAMNYGEVRWSLARHGQPIGPLDTLIGSHANVLDVILVTHKTGEFARIKSLRLEDWIAA